MSNVYIKNYFGNRIFEAELKEVLSDTQSLVMYNGKYIIIDNEEIVSREKYEEQMYINIKEAYDEVIDICRKKMISFKELVNYNTRIDNE